MYLLCIFGIDGIENCKIYKTYMNFGQISDNGKIVQVFGGVVFCRLFQYIGTVETPEIASPWDCLPSLWVGGWDGCYEVCTLWSGDE
jgi:hypothetical protein